MEARKRALVTGACGFIGSHVVDLLVEKGYGVTATDLERAPKTWLNGKAKYVWGDLTVADSLAPLFKNGPYQIIKHTASVFDYNAPRNLLDKVNLTGTFNLLSAAKEYSPQSVVVHWSSGSVVGNTGHIAADEETPPKPKNNYERSKLEQEKMANEFAKTRNYRAGLKTIIVRPAAVYGPRSKYGAAVPIFMIAEGKIPFIIGNGEFVESFVHVADVAGAALHLAENYSKLYELFEKSPETTRWIFNVCDDSRYTIEEMFFWVEKCLREAGRADVRLLPVHYPIWALKPLIWLNWRWAKKHPGLRPPIERDLIDYLSSPFLMSNLKLKLAGYKLKYPDTKTGLKETIGHHRKGGVL